MTYTLYLFSSDGQFLEPTTSGGTWTEARDPNDIYYCFSKEYDEWYIWDRDEDGKMKWMVISTGEVPAIVLATWVLCP